MHVLVTRRLTLRRPTVLDADDIALGLGNWNVARMLGPIPYPYHRRDAEEWIASLAEKPADNLVYTIHRERLIGVVSIEGGGSSPRLGYWLGEPWHGKSFMTEAAQALIAHAFATCGLEAVVSSVFVDNPASLRVQKKLGFAVSGVGETFCRPRGTAVNTLTTRLAAADFGGTAAAMPTQSAA